MERRPYFVIGDLLACTLTGASVAIAVAWTVSPGWNPWLGMVAGMALGTVVAMVVGLLFVPLFGAMEVLLPGMLVGMVAGMWAGMAVPMSAPDTARAGLTGILIGLAALVFVYALNARLTRRSS